MSWHVYSISPIDTCWEHLKSVQETLIAIASDHADPKPIDGVNATSAVKFLLAWESAKTEATKRNWEGDFRQAPCVFWLPNDGTFDYAFVFKQDNGGTTFVVSPHPLPWIKTL